MSNKSFPTLYCCVPLMDELENVQSIYDSLKNQETYFPIKLIFCVNQPVEWWENPTKIHICENNQQTLGILNSFDDKHLIVIDKSSPNLEYIHHGVGWARKLMMDKAIELASDDDIIYSMDADTFYPLDYLHETALQLINNPSKIGISADYFHPISEDKMETRAMLVYEIYMRNYELNMFRIQSPYRFTALGSGIIVWVWGYKKVGAMPEKQAGEDFYFMEKLCKNGELIYSSAAIIYPQARQSNRVLFGTGPAIQSYINGVRNQYPIFKSSYFDEIKRIHNDFLAYYHTNKLSDLTISHLNLVFKKLDWIIKLKNNSKTISTFMKKVHVKFDGLKTIRLIKELYQADRKSNEEEVLKNNLLNHFSSQITQSEKDILLSLDFETTPIQDLNKIRKRMFMIKKEYVNK